MKNIQQINVIHAALVKQRDKMLAEVAKINTLIKGKRDSINKMLQYLNEYHDDKKYKLSRSIPILNRNFDVFKDKINHIIFCEENEIDNLMQFRASKLDEIQKVDNKIKVMDQFKTKREMELAYEAERNEQVAQDDLSSNKHIRKDHD